MPHLTHTTLPNVYCQPPLLNGVLLHVKEQGEEEHNLSSMVTEEGGGGGGGGGGGHPR